VRLAYQLKGEKGKGANEAILLVGKNVGRVTSARQGGKSSRSISVARGGKETECWQREKADDFPK